MTGPLNSSAPTTSIVVGGVYNAVAPTPVVGQECALQVDANGYLLTNAGGGGGSVSQGTSPWVVSGAVTVASTTITGSVAVTGTFYQATQPVSGTFYQATQPVSGTFYQATQPVSGTVAFSNTTIAVTNAGTFAVQATLAAETTKVIGTINQGTSPWVTQATSVPSTSGGCLSNVQQALTTSVNIKGTAGQVYGFDWFNPNAVTVYVFIYNTTTTPGTIGATTVLLYQKGLPAGAGSNEFFNIGLAFSTGIAIAVSTSPTSSAAPSTGLVLTTLYD